MKRFLLSACVALLLLATLLTLCSCSGLFGQDENYEVCETMVYSGMPPISDLIKSIGTSKDEDEERESTSNEEALKASGTSYLVCMCYGTPDANDLMDRLRFVLVSGDELLYNEACVTLGEAKDYDIPNNPFHGAGKRNIEGIMVVPFELHTGKEGTLYVDYDNGSKETLLESPVGSVIEGAEVSVDGMQVGYLTEEAYQDGGFEDADMTKTLTATPGEPSYMVLDVTFTARQKNEGDLSANCHIGFPGLKEGGITIEAAPTTNIKMAERNGVYDVCATYSIPQEKNGEKNVRMVLRINTPEDVGEGIHLLLAGSGAVTMTGTAYVPDLMAEGISFEAFIPVWKRDTMPTWGKVLLTIGVALVLFFVMCVVVGMSSASEWWEWFMPLVSWLATTVLMILLFCLTSFAWWVVLIDIVSVYIALMLSHVLASNIVDSNVGNNAPVAISLLLCAVGSVLLLLLAPWIWWIPLLAAVGISAVSALIFGAIGYHM